MTIFSKRFFSISILTTLLAGVSSSGLCDIPQDYTAPRLAPSSQHHTNIDQFHADQLEILTKVIRVLRENREIKCNPEEKVLVNRLFETITLSIVSRAVSEERNCEIAHKLRTIAQIFNLSSPELDNAQGCSPREETDTIIRALQLCLAERNFSHSQRTFRNLVEKLEPYKAHLVIAALPFLAYGAYRLNGVMRDCVVNALQATELSRKADAANPVKAAPTSPHIMDSWNLVSAALVIPAGKTMYDYLNSTVFKHTLEKATDNVKKMWAKLQGLNSNSSNPASASKVALKDVPAVPAMKEHLGALARMVVSQEDVYKQQGGTGLKTLLIHGDTSLAQLLASGLADEVVRLSREKGVELACPVAVIHSSKFTKKSFKEELEKITMYNKACVIVIQDLDWITDTAASSTIVAEIIGGIKSASRLYEQYIVIGTARSIAQVDVALRQPLVFANRLMVDPAQDSSLLRLCIERAEQVYGVTITQSDLRARLEAYICHSSFGDFMNLFAAAYTKSLPQVYGHRLDEHAIARELALVEPTMHALS